MLRTPICLQKWRKKKVKEKGGVLVHFFCLFNHYFISLAILSLVTICCIQLQSFSSSVVKISSTIAKFQVIFMFIKILYNFVLYQI